MKEFKLTQSQINYLKESLILLKNDRRLSVGGCICDRERKKILKNEIEEIEKLKSYLEHEDNK